MSQLEYGIRMPDAPDDWGWNGSQAKWWCAITPEARLLCRPRNNPKQVKVR